MRLDRYICCINVAALFTLIGCSGETTATPPDKAHPATVAEAAALTTREAARTGPDVANGARLIRECTVCHAITPEGRHQVGPKLWGVTGQPAARHADFSYSRALRQAGLTWTDETLDAYLASPQTVVPGGRMAYAGLGSPNDREDLIAYLHTLTDADYQ